MKTELTTVIGLYTPNHTDPCDNILTGVHLAMYRLMPDTIRY